MRVVVIKLILAQLFQRDAVQESDCREHVPPRFDFEICGLKDFLKEPPGRQRRESPVPRAAPIELINLSDARKCSQKHSARLEDAMQC